jgi:hypothetical protein
MKSVEILIPNFNSGEAVELCIESIRKYAGYPFTMTVRDDATWSVPDKSIQLFEGYGDLRYLRTARDKGWLNLIEGKTRTMHGTSVGIMLDQCMADLAMIVDCDMQFLSSGWLADMVALQEKADAAMIVKMEHFPDDNDCLQSWFVMVDMKQYPLVRDDWEYREREDGKPGLRATGYYVWKNIRNRGLVWIPTPENIIAKYYHHGHISVLSAPQIGKEWEVRQNKYARVQAELRRFRRENGASA